MALRLPANERQAFLEEFGTALVEQHGSVMKEYVAVPDELLEDTDRLRTHFETSHAYAGSLKPKPGKKAKPSTKRAWSPSGR